MEDKHFHDILDELQHRDALVMNNTRVLPARLYGENLKQAVIWKFYF